MHAIVHAADIQDRDGGVLLMTTLFGLYPFLLKLYADGGYQGAGFQGALRTILKRVNVELVKRSDLARCFVVLPTHAAKAMQSKMMFPDRLLEFGERVMPEYRIYTLDYNCHRVDAKNIECVDDLEAVQQAVRTITSYDVEVWQRASQNQRSTRLV